MKIINVMGFPVFKGDLSQIKVESKYQFLVNTISPNSYGLSVVDARADRALRGSDLLVLDGVYFGWASLVLKGEKINRITGMDAFKCFSKWANKNNGKVFFMGSTNETLKKIKYNYSKEYPNAEVDFYSPPYKQEFSEEDNLLIYAKINAFNPDIVFVGLTAPKQEKWGFENKKYLNVKVIFTIGNVFDWYAGNSKRPSIFWQKIGMEWFIRIFHRPEIFRRNIKNQMTFFWHLFLIIIKIKKND